MPIRDPIYKGMDIDDATPIPRVYVLCPRCQELNLQYSDEYPIVCCGVPGITFGAGRCSRCCSAICVDKEEMDLCLTCRLMMMDISAR